jgi:hypothetical protein
MPASRTRPPLRLLTLEDRTTPATNRWIEPNGGAWATDANWSLGHVPRPDEDVVIDALAVNPVTVSAGANVVNSLTLSAGLTITGGSLAVTGFGTVAGSLMVRSGGSFIVAAGSDVDVVPGAVVIGNSSSAAAATLVVNGRLDVDQAQFLGAGTHNSSGIQVKAGGRLTAVGSSFDWSGISFASGTFGAGDLVGNSFTCPVTLPYDQVEHLSGPSNENLAFETINILPGTMTAGEAATLGVIGASSPDLTYVFSGSFRVGTGAGLTVGPGVPVVLRPNTQLTVDGAAYFGADTAVTFEYAYGASTQIAVGGGGLLNATGATFGAQSLSYNFTQVLVGGGGRLVSAGSAFALSRVYIDADAQLDAGDLTDSTFASPLFLAYYDVPHLSAAAPNRSFRDVNILTGTMNAGEALDLAYIGQSSPDLRYVFPGNFTVGAGATLTTDPNIRVVLQNNAQLVVDGSADLGAGGSVTFVYAYGANTQIVVGALGTLRAKDKEFTAESLSYNFTQVLVNGSGRLVADGCTFALSRLYLSPSVDFRPGDLKNNTFALPLYLPYYDVPDLSAGVGNRSFRDVNVLTGSMIPGEAVELGDIGASSPDLRWVFPNDFTVGAGAALGVAPNVRVALGPGATLTVRGAMGFAPGGSASFLYAYGATTQVVVTGGGVLTAADTTFTAESSSSNFTQVAVTAGGRLVADGCTFALSRLYLTATAALDRGDLTDGTYNLPVHIPVLFADRLAGNRQFQDVVLLPGELAAGQTATLAPLGVTTTQRYVLDATTGSLNVRAGATLDVLPGAKVVAVESNNTPFGLVVNGTMNVAGGEFTKTGSNNSSTLQVNDGGRLTATARALFGWANVSLGSGAVADARYVRFANKLTVHSGAAVDVTANDFSGIAANGVVAVGTPTAHIDLTGNYWGGLQENLIPGKILDHEDDATRPYIDFLPKLDNPPVAPFSPAALPPARAGAAFDQPLTPVGGGATNFRISRGALPPGLALSAAGVLSGTPTAVGSYTFTVEADAGAAVLRQLYWVTVAPPEITFTPTQVPATQAGVAYNLALTAGGGTAPYTQFTVTAGALPAGLTLSAAGVLSGTTNVADGPFDFTVTVTDSTTGPNAPYTGSKAYRLIVDSTPPAPGTVNDGPGADVEFQASGSTIVANWGGFGETGSGIGAYAWAIGTTPGAADVRPFTDVGTSTSATGTGLGLTNGSTYYVTVRATDNAGNVGAPATSDGITVDTAPPAPGAVNDGPGADADFQGDTTSIAANWAGFADAGSGVATYAWAIGTTPGGTDVRPFTNVGAATAATAAGLSLARGTKYYVTVRATDAVGNVGPTATSDGVTVVPPAPVIVGYSDDTGVAGDGITRDTTLTLTGTAEAGATVEVFTGATALGTTVANGCSAPRPSPTGFRA